MMPTTFRAASPTIVSDDHAGANERMLHGATARIADSTLRPKRKRRLTALVLAIAGTANLLSVGCSAEWLGAPTAGTSDNDAASDNQDAAGDGTDPDGGTRDVPGRDDGGRTPGDGATAADGRGDERSASTDGGPGVPGSATHTARTIATRSSHTCAITSTGGIVCWGSNYDGRLGDGTTTTRKTPTAVVGITSAVEVTTGRLHSCAVLASGTAKCWGDNGLGTLGDASAVQRLTPVDVVGLAGVKGIAAGDTHTCALVSSGLVKCWGQNTYGELGDGTTGNRLTPVDVLGITTAVDVVVGDRFSCALLSSGDVTCWGRNTNGYLGRGFSNDAPNSAGPKVGLSKPAIKIAASSYHACALLNDGTMRCWGSNDGRYGNGSTLGGGGTPVAAIGVTSGVDIAAGVFHTCAVLASGTLRCWGSNIQGQIGDGTTSQRLAPADAQGTSYLSVVAGTSHTCARAANGVSCWGANGDQLGVGATASSLNPLLVTIP